MQFGGFLRFGMSAAVLVGIVNPVAGQSAGREIDLAIVRAESRAADEVVRTRSMYPTRVSARQEVDIPQAAEGERSFLGPMQLNMLADAAGETTGSSTSAVDLGVDVSAPAEQAAPVFSIRQDLKNTPRWLWEDTKRVYTNPLGLGLLMTAGGAAIALHQHVDWTIANKFDRSHTCKDDWRDTANIVGHPVLHLGVAGAWYLAGYEFKDLKTYNVGKNLLSALIITDLSTLALKGAAAGTETPSGGHMSFPSGHVSSSFALASVLHHAYGPVVGVPMYGVAGWVAFARMDDRKHFLSDVVFGGMLGLVVGHSVAMGHLPQIAGGNIIPYADPVDGTAGVAWWKSMK